MSPLPPIRVGIIEDQAAVREGLSRLFLRTPDFQLTGAYASVEAASQMLGNNLPQVLLVDLSLPGMSGIEGIRSFHESWPKLILIVLTVHEENHFIFEALCAGANGYLLKSTRPESLLRSIAEAVSGGAPMTPSIASKVIQTFRESRKAPSAETALTPHEMRILKLLASGENYKTSATLLKVSVNTISFHVRNIYSKLQVHSRSDAVAAGLRRGLIH